MKVLYNKVFKNYLIITGCLFLLEFIFKIVNGFSIFNWSLIRIFLGVNIIGLFFSFLYSFAGRIIGNALTIITCLAATIYSIVQTGFYNFLGTFISFNTSSQLDAVTDYFTDFMNSFKWYYWILLLPFILVCSYYIFVEHKVHVMQLNEEIDFSDKFDSKERKGTNSIQ